MNESILCFEYLIHWNNLNFGTWKFQSPATNSFNISVILGSAFMATS